MSKRTLFSADNMMSLLEKENNKSRFLEKELFPKLYEEKIRSQMYRKIISNHRNIVRSLYEDDKYTYDPMKNGRLIKEINKINSKGVIQNKNKIKAEFISEGINFYAKVIGTVFGEPLVSSVKERIDAEQVASQDDGYKQLRAKIEVLHKLMEEMKGQLEAKEKSLEITKKLSLHLAAINDRRTSKMKEKFEVWCNELNNGNYSLDAIANPTPLNPSKQSYSLKIYINDKNLIIDKKVPTFSKLCDKQLQQNLRAAYKIKQADRHMIIKQLKAVLSNEVPKIVIKLDISSFYESIPHDKIVEKLKKDKLISYTSIHILEEIFKRCREKYKVIGLPRGIGISAYLAELYMRDFDNVIRKDISVIFYARYVDDIVIVLGDEAVNDYQNPSNPKHSSQSDILFSLKNMKNFSVIKTAYDYLKDLDLEVSNSKTKCSYIGISSQKSYRFDYLGYSFIPQEKGAYKLGLSKNRMEKYKQRIENALSSNLRQKQMVKNMRLLTSNTRLKNNKGNVFIGIYFSNKEMNYARHLCYLDLFYQRLLNQKPISKRMRCRLSKISFQDGFEKKIYVNFSINEITKIMKSIDKQ